MIVPLMARRDPGGARGGEDRLRLVPAPAARLRLQTRPQLFQLIGAPQVKGQAEVTHPIRDPFRLPRRFGPEAVIEMNRLKVQPQLLPHRDQEVKQRQGIRPAAEGNQTRLAGNDSAFFL